MNARAAALLMCLALALPGTHAADSGPTAHAVTATPPIQAVPAHSVSKRAQARMRDCNAAADGRKLANGARESFIKTCMAPRHNRASAVPDKESKTHP